MKKIAFTLFALICSLLCSSPSFANSRDWRTDVISHPAVTALLQLMNVKYSGSCVSPTANDVVTDCTGAIPTVAEPTLVNEPCYFSLALKCAGGSATVSGERQLYMLISPSQPSKAADPVIVIHDVQLQ